MKGRQQCLLPAFWGGMKEMCGSLYRDRKAGMEEKQKKDRCSAIEEKKKAGS